VLTVVKPVRITHLTVALHGFVGVYKNATALGEVPPVELAIVQTQTSTKARYLGNGYASLFHDEITLCGEGRLEPGVYEFEFNLEFPEKDLPTSINVCARFMFDHRSLLILLYSLRGEPYPT
jgi:hypothetical protein